MKRSICLILSILLLLSFTACEEPTPASDFDYTVTKKGEAIIYDYLKNDETVIIPGEIEGNPVKMIGGYAFFGNQALKTVKIPDTVIYTQNYTFANCTSLKNVELGQGLTEISGHDFENCSSLEEVVLPQNLEKIGPYAFANCSLKEINIPKTVTSMGVYAFLNNRSLEKIELEEGVTIIGDGAFQSVKALKEVTIPASVTRVGAAAFYFCDSLKEVTFLGDAPKEVGSGAFGKPNKNIKIYYNGSAKGWDTTTLKDDYTLVKI